MRSPLTASNQERSQQQPAIRKSENNLFAMTKSSSVAILIAEYGVNNDNCVSYQSFQTHSFYSVAFYHEMRETHLGVLKVKPSMFDSDAPLACLH